MSPDGRGGGDRSPFNREARVEVTVKSPTSGQPQMLRCRREELNLNSAINAPVYHRVTTEGPLMSLHLLWLFCNQSEQDRGDNICGNASATVRRT